MKQDVEDVIRYYSMINDEYFMNEALKEAKKAYKKEEIPVGCVITFNDKIIARGHNLKMTKNSPILHAEMVAISRASKKLKSYYLEGCKLYVSLEPCPMCVGAIMQSKIRNIYFGAYDKAGGACGSIINLFNYKFQNPSVDIKGGFLEEEAKKLLQDFFKDLREKKKKD